ncbi:AsmA family protein [Gluconobacter kondonii]|uniref:AsmA family protein n=1 Tax=Gluconobacter kondonii TaxID=941463 RepID=UPI001B8D5518|nr:AsmA family protein [Gluconobacter kondonii]MBS1065465.1 AsmA family protein [Gluconobacter kondonii]MBS1082717.1 AsmA family protein [Gluconobacter kondonii]
MSSTPPRAPSPSDKPLTGRGKRHRRLKTAGGIVGALVAALIVLVLVWQWDWFVPYIDRKATAALHRPVSIAHLHVHLGFKPTIRVDDLKIGQPEGFGKEKNDFASAHAITVKVDAWRYLTGGGLSVLLIRVDTPKGDIVSLADGTNNYTFPSSSNTSSQTASPSTTLPKLGKIEINDGDIRVAMAKLKTDMHVLIHTVPPKDGDDGHIVIDLEGRYARAPITGHIVGGALLDITDTTHPYPIDGRLANGPTYITLRGTVDDPIHFRGTNLALHFAGPDMALLYPLTGVPIPETPAYSVTGNLAYSDHAIRFQKFEGHMGSSDIGGDINVNPHQKPILVDAALHSHQVDLADLGGFIGAQPGAAKKAEPASTRVLPDKAINVPKLNAANVHLTYHGDHIRNKNWPLDNIDTELDIHDGAIDLKHLTFATGTGTISANATLEPTKNAQFHTRFRLDVSRLPLSRIMTSKDMFQGEGTIGGHVTLNSTGNSVATLVENGNGGTTLVLDRGGDVTALLPDLLGLKLGSAILSALGIPDRSKLECLVADLPLKDGIVHTDAMLLQTGTTRTSGTGTVNFHKDTLDYAITTRSIGPQILSLPGAVHIFGPINNPTILPGAELIGRVAASVGLGIVFPPAALIPTIQLGVGKGSACEKAILEANEHPAAGIAPGASTGSGPSSIPHPAHPQTATHPQTSHHRLSPAEIHKAWEKKSNPK